MINKQYWQQKGNNMGALNSHENNIIKTIQKISGKYNQNQIFTDWTTCCAMSFANIKEENEIIFKQREDLYLNIINKYSKSERDMFAEMLSELTLSLDEELGDSLGKVFMTMNQANKAIGQFFTPFSTSKLCAQIILKDKIDELKKDNSKVYRLLEPSCGSGGMIIAMVQEFVENKINPQKQLKVVAQDIDSRAVCMTFVQLTLLGLDAVIAQGNTLSEPFDGTNYPEDRTLRTVFNKYKNILTY